MAAPTCRWWRSPTTTSPGRFRQRARHLVDQVGVVPAWRGHGLGAHLVSRVLLALAAERAPEARLTVNTNNPAGDSPLREAGLRAPRQAGPVYDRWLKLGRGCRPRAAVAPTRG